MTTQKPYKVGNKTYATYHKAVKSSIETGNKVEKLFRDQVTGELYYSHQYTRNFGDKTAFSE